MTDRMVQRGDLVPAHNPEPLPIQVDVGERRATRQRVLLRMHASVEAHFECLSGDRPEWAKTYLDQAAKCAAIAEAYRE